MSDLKTTDRETTMEARTKLSSAQRRRAISRLVISEGSANTEELAARFDVSYMTIWRDITTLEQDGKLLRVRGGALPLETADQMEPAYLSKQPLHHQAKEAIARYAAMNFVEDGDVLFLEAGTTAAAVTKYLTQKNLTVVTNGVQTIYSTLPMLTSLTVMSCGGILRDKAHTFVGPQAERFFEEIRAKTFFLGATGITVADGISDPNPLEVQVKRAMAASAERTILLVDSSKFGIRSLLPIVSFDALTALVTDENAPHEDVAAIRALGIDVHLVAPAT